MEKVQPKSFSSPETRKNRRSNTDVALHTKRVEMATALHGAGNITDDEYGVAVVHYEKIVNAKLVAGGVVPVGEFSENPNVNVEELLFPVILARISVY